MNYYKRHIGDWARKTSHLTFLEDAAYNRLIDIYYDRESPIPDGEAERLARARSTAEKKAVRQVLGEFFHLVDGGWTHGRCDEEITKLQAAADASKDNGKKGGRPKKETHQVNGDEPENNPAGFKLEPANNLTPRLQDSNQIGGAEAPLPAKGPKSKKSAKTALPPDFALTDELRAYAVEKLPGVNVDEMFSIFCDKAKSKGWTNVDWSLTWQVYVRNASPTSGHFSKNDYPRVTARRERELAI